MHFLNRTIPLDRIFPYLGVFDDIVVSVRGPLTCGWEITYPAAYTRTEKEYDDMTDILASAMRVLPAWTVLHRQDVYYYDRYDPGSDEGLSFLGRSDNAHFRGRRYLTHKSYIFVSRCSKGMVMKEGRYSGFFGQGSSFEVPTEQELQVFRTQCHEFMSVIGTCANMRMRVLREKDWMGEGQEPGIMQRYLMLGNRGPVMCEPRCSHESVEVHGKEALMVMLADSDHLPGEVSNISRVEKLSGTANDIFLSTGAKIGINLECEHVVNEIFVIPDQTALLSELDTTRKEEVSGFSSTDNRLNSEEIRVFLDDAYSKGLIGLLAHVNVVAWDGPDNMMDLVGKLSAAIKSMNCTAVFNKHSMPQVWYACCPGCAFDVGSENLMKMEMKSALCLLPCETFDDGIPGGKLLMCCDRVRNIPLRLDFQFLAQKRGLVGNYNIFVLGSSGSGKSFFTNMYIRSLYDAGQYIFDIDVGGSYWGLAHVISEESGGRDGQYFEFSLEHPLSFGPFRNFRDFFDADGSVIMDHPDIGVFILFLQTVFTPNGGWTSAGTAVLRHFLSTFLEQWPKHGDVPVLEDFYVWMEKDVVPKVKHPLLTEDDCRKRRVIALTDARRAEAGRKRFSLSSEMKNELELEAERWLQGSRKEVEEMILADARENGYVIGAIPVTAGNFDIDSFMQSLLDYRRDGVYGFLLNERNPRDLMSSRFVVVDLEALQGLKDTPFYSACVLLTTHEFKKKMMLDQRTFKNFIIDEAWAAIANGTLGPYLQELWKTARKNNCSAMCITQQLSDIMSSEFIKDTIQQNSDIKILLDQKSNMNNFDMMISLLNLSQQAKNLILSMNNANNPEYFYKEVFVSLGNLTYAVYAFEASPEGLVCYESNREKKRPFVELSRQMGSCIGAIKAIVESTRRS